MPRLSSQPWLPESCHLLDDDVKKMIRQGVATKADGLKVDVKVNEADMDITRVDDGVTLAKMLLCQLCGIPMTDKITLADEEGNGLEKSNVNFTDYQPDSTFSSRPEVRLLQNAVDLSEQGTKVIQAEVRSRSRPLRLACALRRPVPAFGYWKNDDRQ